MARREHAREPGGTDAGAHLDLLATFNATTAMLENACAKRDLMGWEEAVNLITDAPAQMYGITDRGRLAEGYHADVNVIDHDGLTLHKPHMIHDLPAGGRRLVQDADGYLATLKAGEVVVDHDEVTDARPGRTLKATDAGVRRV